MKWSGSQADFVLRNLKARVVSEEYMALAMTTQVQHTSYRL